MNEAARELAHFAWTLRAYPQGLAGQDRLLGVASEDIMRLRMLAETVLKASDVSPIIPATTEHPAVYRDGKRLIGGSPKAGISEVDHETVERRANEQE